MSVITRDVKLTIPNQAIRALNVADQELETYLRLVAAIKLYELGQLSSGAAAQFADLPKPLFLNKLAEFGVDTFTLKTHEFAQETRLV